MFVHTQILATAVWTNPKEQNCIVTHTTYNNKSHLLRWRSVPWGYDSTSWWSCQYCIHLLPLGDLYPGDTIRRFGDRVSIVYTCYLGDLYPGARTRRFGDRVSAVYTLCRPSAPLPSSCPFVAPGPRGLFLFLLSCFLTWCIIKTRTKDLWDINDKEKS